MKTIGKIAALAMTLSLAFVLTACGGNASSSAASSASASASAASSAAASSESASASADSASAASTSASASSAAATADTYENEFFGISFSLPAGWSFMDTSTIKDMNALMAALSQNGEIDMVASNADSSQVVVVSIEPPSAENSGKTADQFLEAQQKSLTDSIQGTVSYTSTSASITFEGIDRELPAAITNLDINGVQLCMCEAVAEKDGYFFDVVAIGANQDEVTSAFENFKSVKA